MLSALAKYIFGGVMGDAPETTSMQYETREINDWLLVDMPDQDIDNEDLDSESDDDDILTAVPLLLAEEVSMSPRQLVLSYEPDCACDKSCAKIRKNFQDKIHSASAKVQIHTGDKIQGNFIANVEAISVETDDISNDKVQSNLSKIQENVKSKQSKSKNSKLKKSKKNKVNKKCSVKIQDTSVINKKYFDDIKEKPNLNNLLNLKEDIQYISNEISENLGAENNCTIVDSVEDCHTTAIINNCSQKRAAKIKKSFNITVTDNSNHNNDCKIVDRVEDCHAAIISNCSQKREAKIKESFCITVKGNSIHKNEDKVVEDSHNAIVDDSIHRNKNISDNFLENFPGKIEENVPNESEVPKTLNTQFQPNVTTLESNLCNLSKRSYADVVKSKFDIIDKDCNKAIPAVKVCKTELEAPEAFLCNKADDIQLNLKDNDSLVPRNKMQNDAYIKSQNVSVSVFVSYQDESKTNESDNRDMLDKIEIIPSEVQENLNDKIENNLNENYISKKNTEKTHVGIMDTSLAEYEYFSNQDLENHASKVLENFEDKSKPEISLAKQNYKIIEDTFEDKNEANLTENIFIKNLTFNNSYFQNEATDFTDDIYFNNSDNENTVNLIDICQIHHREVNENQVKQDSFEFEQSSDDGMLENIADLWDIYTKIQDNSDDEAHEISDDEMSEDFNESLQETSDREITENFEQITDDEMNENLQDEYEEISCDEINEKFCGKILKNLFQEKNAKPYNRIFEYNLDDESEESDNELFINSLILPLIKNNMERNSEILQSFKCDFLEKLKPNASEISKNHSSCVPLTEYELVKYFNFEPENFYACQSLQYPSSYALAIAEFYSSHDQYFPKNSDKCNAFIQKCKRRVLADNLASPASSEPSLVANTAELLEKIINQKCSVLPTKTAVVLEHVKDLKPAQQAIQYEARKYLTRSQLSRQNRNYIYQSSTKTNRRKNLQRNPSGVNNNRKCY